MFQPQKYFPQFKERQILFDADVLEEPDHYLAFPSLYVASGGIIVIAYKRGSAHYQTSASLEVMRYDPVQRRVVMRQLIDAEPEINHQNPELLCMPNRQLVIYQDTQQPCAPTVRLGIKEYRSDDEGKTWNRVFRSPDGLVDNLGIVYGYVYDMVQVDGTVFLVASAFGYMNERNGAVPDFVICPRFESTQNVHVIKSEDSGETWQHVCNLTDSFDCAFNECTFLPYGDGFVFFTRGNDTVTHAIRCDKEFQLEQKRNLSEGFHCINYWGRPKLFCADGRYFVLTRNYPITGGPMELNLYEFDLEQLAPLSYIELEPANSKDGFYAESYFCTQEGQTNLEVVTYSQVYSKSPDILLLRYRWDELKGAARKQ